MVRFLPKAGELNSPAFGRKRTKLEKECSEYFVRKPSSVQECQRSSSCQKKIFQKRILLQLNEQIERFRMNDCRVFVDHG